MEELVLITLDGCSKKVTPHNFYSRYEKLGYKIVEESKPKTRRRRAPATDTSAE